MCHYDEEFLERVSTLVKSRTWLELKFDEVRDDNYYVYVDHADQSIFTSMDDEMLLKYLFSHNSEVLTWNDNDDSYETVRKAGDEASEKWMEVFFKDN